MNDSLNLLVTFLYNGRLLKAAIKLPKLGADDADPRDPENWKILREKFPLHVRSCGEIVAVEKLFEVTIVEGGNN